MRQKWGRPPRSGVLLLAGLLLLAACAPLAREPVRTSPPNGGSPPPAESLRPAPEPIELPRDDAPHGALLEWWYYTGHLRTDDGRRYGFEFVVFQTVRAEQPVGYLAQFAVTDPQRERFRYAARASQRPAPPANLELEVDGWVLRGGDGRDELRADLGEYALELELAALKPPVLHHGGSISFGPAGDSYYYSRTRLAAGGRLREGETWTPVRGEAWFDHQWGDFVVASVGGWDWFSLQLEDGSELMLSVVRIAGLPGMESGPGPEGSVPLVAGDQRAVFGSYVDPTGRAVDVPAEAVVVDTLGTWTSPYTGARYPSGWQIGLSARPDLGLPEARLHLEPLLRDQELAFERLPYWEGAVDASGTLAGRSIRGQGYVELTGYAP